ncbi:MAG: diaminopimelate epimerase [Clostridia bacterium]|nr:diaminopimelate epimerase [Clostridia bacterium]NCC77439.1 diaminopimelate epimerase [Clostridia bacterium]
MIGKNILVFTKMHGAGNDYIYINAIAQPVADPENLAVRLSDRHFGIGGDGIVLIKPSRTADFFMDMYNADGSRGKMCGNAIRCVAKYVHDRRLTDKTTLEIETLSGIKTLELHLDDNRQVATVTVNMGAPIFTPDQILVRFAGEKMIEAPVEVDGQTYKLTSVSMGNPHTVIFITDVKDLDLARIGPSFEHLPIFPDRVNTEFCEVIDRQTLRMRVWERGSGETLACGTGACATLAAAVVTGRADRKARLELTGGTLDIEWDETSNDLFMTGPAEFVFDGTVNL